MRKKQKELSLLKQEGAKKAALMLKLTVEDPKAEEFQDLSPLDLAEGPEKVWKVLDYLDESGKRLMTNVSHLFHALTFWLLDEWMKGKDAKDRKDEIAVLIEWTMDICRSTRFWTGWDDKIKSLTERCRNKILQRKDLTGSEKDLLNDDVLIDKPARDGEEMLRRLWRIVDKELANFLETNYHQVSRSAGWLLSRYNFRAAGSVLNNGLGWKRAVRRMVFGLPIFAGIIIGWLVLLQADEAIKFIFGSPVWRIGVVSVLALGLSLLVIEEAAASRGIKGIKRSWGRAFMVVLLALAASVATGFFFIWSTGNGWLNELLPDSAARLRPLCLWEWEKGWRVLLVWPSMAVFIGIFTQIIWTGRGPTEPFESSGQ